MCNLRDSVPHFVSFLDIITEIFGMNPINLILLQPSITELSNLFRRLLMKFLLTLLSIPLTQRFFRRTSWLRNLPQSWKWAKDVSWQLISQSLHVMYKYVVISYGVNEGSFQRGLFQKQYCVISVATSSAFLAERSWVSPRGTNLCDLFESINAFAMCSRLNPPVWHAKYSQQLAIIISRVVRH